VNATRWKILITLVVIVPAGLATKFVLPHRLPEPLGRWCLLYGAAVLYEVFWILAALLVVLSMKEHRAGIAVDNGEHASTGGDSWKCLVLRAALAVFVVTCFLEVTQRWHAPWLDAVRATGLGAALLGNGFDWWDFPHYAIGSALGAYLALTLGPRNINL
jgi:hypothetical protein